MQSSVLSKCPFLSWSCISSMDS